MKPVTGMTYIQQYGKWYSATPEQWRKIIQAALTDGGYNLDVQARALSGKPRTVSGNKYDGWRASDGIVVRPLDWTTHEWLQLLERAESLPEGKS